MIRNTVEPHAEVWTTVMITVAFGSSAQLMMIGVLSEHICCLNERVKRPLVYVTAERINFNNGSSQQNGISL